MSEFIHLHTHSHFSLLNALPKIKDLVAAAKEDEMSALALTDNGNLYGAIPFYKECKSQGIKPIIGIDAFMALRSRHDKEARIDNKRSRLILLAQNKEGYHNLLKLVTLSHLEGFYYKPRIDRELLEAHSKGLIAIIPSFSGDTSLALKSSDKEKVLEHIDWYKKVFNKENLFLEITHHPEIDGHAELTKKIVSFSKSARVPLVAAHDVYYLKRGDKQARNTVLKIQTGADFGEQGGLQNNDEDFSFINQKTAKKYFKDFPEALTNTEKIAEKCNLELELGTWVFPEVQLEKGQTYNSALKDLTEKGIEKRGLKKTKELEERITYELDIIIGKGYAPYFLAVADLIRFAHENNILTTTRGSAAGSIVSYLTKITNVNPIEYELPFERFLNPLRPSAPDVDMDFADDRRDEVIQYAKDKYGDDHVAQIGTFGTMMARAAVRDVARALDYPYAVGDRLAKLIPLGSQGFPMTIDRAIDITPELKEIYKKEEDAKKIINLAKKIEGNTRHISVHAAGVVIAPKPLTEYVPLQLDPKGGKIITQYDMHAVEDAGLLKFDFLGIKNLASLADSVKRVKKLRKIDIDIENIPLDDKKTFEMLARGETEGVFQLNGSGMTRFLKDLEPTTIHDINAMVALYRPGPMLNIPEYIARKKGEREVTYYHPKMKSFLERSFGILVYQDDLIFTALEIAGYNWETVDKFRKAVGKKIPEEMAKQHKIFVAGCQEHSQMSEADAEGLWKLFEPFQGYGFNKAHAASYGKVAYQTAYMKANFPVEYMAAILTADAGDTEKVSESIIECKRMGISVLPPDVNESLGDFAVVKNEEGIQEAIRFGLYSIKNFGEGIADVIIAERKENGKFTSLSNFLERIRDKNLNKKSVEALILSGAFDAFEERGTMYANVERLLTYNKELGQAPENQDSLFGTLPESESASAKLILEKVEPMSQDEKLSWEKELLGLYISGHPLDKYSEKLKRVDKDIKHTKEELKEGMVSIIAGIVEDSKEILTKKNERMVFMRLADFSDNIEIVVFPSIFSKRQALVAPEQCIAIKGKISNRGGDISLIAEDIKAL